MTDDRPRPWERQPYDTQSTWQYFQLYLEQDPPRSLLGAYHGYLRHKRGRVEVLPKSAPGSWKNLAQGRKRSGDPIPGAITWAERALAWDDHLAAIERQKWADRRLKIKEEEWEIGSKLLEKARQMLMFPVVATESADGHSIIMPAGWRLRDIPAVTAAASKLVRLAAEMNTEKVEIDWRDEARKAGVDNPDELFRQLVSHFEKRLGGDDAQGSLEEGETEPGETGE